MIITRKIEPLVQWVAICDLCKKEELFYHDISEYYKRCYFCQKHLCDSCLRPKLKLYEERQDYPESWCVLCMECSTHNQMLFDKIKKMEQLAEEERDAISDCLDRDVHEMIAIAKLDKPTA